MILVLLKKKYKNFIHFLSIKKRYLKYRKIIKNEFSKGKESKKRIILIGSPEHENLGDHAISIAQIKFIQELLPKYKVCEITGNAFRCAKKYLKRLIREDDIILVTGGGLMGDLWPEEEQMIVDILRSFYDHKIVIMPQTIFFSESESSQVYKMQLNEAIIKCRKLTVMCRDKRSCQYFKDSFGISAKWMPDMVLFMQYDNGPSKRNGVSMCIRNDKERIIDDDCWDYVFNAVSAIGNIVEVSTIAPFHVAVSQRECELEKVLDSIASSRLLVTDRLHAMLFAAITGTPCIAFDNISHKISGVYEWISNCSYIECVSTLEEFDKALSALDINKKNEYKRQLLEPYFNTVAQLIEENV